MGNPCSAPPCTHGPKGKSRPIQGGTGEGCRAWQRRGCAHLSALVRVLRGFCDRGRHLQRTARRHEMQVIRWIASPRLRAPPQGASSARRAERSSMAKLEPAARAEEHASHMKLLENALKVGAAPLIARARAQLSPRAAGTVPQGARNQLAEQSRLLGDTQQRVRAPTLLRVSRPSSLASRAACACSM